MGRREDARFLEVIIVILTLASSINAQTDLTRQPGAQGSQVVNAVVDVIRHSCIFPADKYFLRRLAFAESQDGISGRTYRPGFDGGIWQVDLAQLNATHYSSVVDRFIQPINDKFGIDWREVSWSDLRKPLYSGLAASLYIETLGTAVPRGIEEQSVYWTDTYKSVSSQLAYNFTIASELLKEHCQQNQTIDLVFILDSSSSISPSDFERVKDFVLAVIDIFSVSPDDARISVITYSTEATVQFYLNTFATKEEVRSRVKSIEWQPGTSATAEALDLAVNVVFTPEHGGRVKVPKAAIVFSDGQSNDFYETEAAAARLREFGVTVFAVGVGTELDLFELQAVASDPDCTHLFLVESYTEIDTLVQEIQHASCRTPIVLNYNETVYCELKADEKCVFQTRNVSSLHVSADCNKAIIYSSFSNPYPGAAFYDLTSVATVNQPIDMNIQDESSLYISVQGSPLGAGLNESARCFATLGPLPHQNGGVELICRENQENRECKIPQDLLQYKSRLCNNDWWDFHNPCSLSAVKSGEIIFPHPYNANMYLTCDQTGNVYIVVCPPEMLFDQKKLQCGAGDTTSRAKNQTDVEINPCSADQLFQGHFFFPHLGDHHKFIHCDVWGHPWIMDCQLGFVWDQRELTCVEEFLIGVTPDPDYNPCTKESIAMGKLFFPYPDDNKYYIRCDAWGEAFVMPCDPGTVWNQEVTTCVWPSGKRAVQD